MVVERLARHHTPATTVDELWHCVEAAYASVPILKRKKWGKRHRSLARERKSVRSVRKCPLLARGAGKRRKERRSGKMDRERKTKPLLLANFVDIG
ncbi:hypothetical protein TNCV_5085601 [Trichonephila clavipes]|uniref:Uncharacterized protein n=1 Tax=Trichonephila clavipes TaxID=2585209 RepID=A0A8X6S9U1_TRICX|nr:hypothetical protein TNCV_5085601 [Trichonephila clavipes]